MWCEPLPFYLRLSFIYLFCFHCIKCVMPKMSLIYKILILHTLISTHFAFVSISFHCTCLILFPYYFILSRSYNIYISIRYENIFLCIKLIWKRRNRVLCGTLHVAFGSYVWWWPSQFWQIVLNWQKAKFKILLL